VLKDRPSAGEFIFLLERPVYPPLPVSVGTELSSPPLIATAIAVANTSRYINARQIAALA
jgi:hypothetical protein